MGRYLEALLAEWGRPQSPFERVRVYLPGSPRVEPDAFGDKIEFRVVAGSLPPLLWENVLLPSVIDDFDLLFAPYTLPWSLVHRGVVSNLGIYEDRRGDF